MLDDLQTTLKERRRDTSPFDEPVPRKYARRARSTPFLASCSTKDVDLDEIRRHITELEHVSDVHAWTVTSNPEPTPCTRSRCTPDRHETDAGNRYPRWTNTGLE
jgi:hypothetical protein